MNTIAETAEETVRSYFDAMERSDVDSIVGLFAPDGHLMAEHFPTASGTVQILQTFEGAFQVMKMCCSDLGIDRVTTTGEVAVVEAHSTETVTMLAANTSTEIQFRELFVLRRSGSGWLITDYIFNRPQGPNEE